MNTGTALSAFIPRDVKHASSLDDAHHRPRGEVTRRFEKSNTTVYGAPRLRLVPPGLQGSSPSQSLTRSSKSVPALVGASNTPSDPRTPSPSRLASPSGPATPQQKVLHASVSAPRLSIPLATSGATASSTITTSSPSPIPIDLPPDVPPTRSARLNPPLTQADAAVRLQLGDAVLLGSTPAYFAGSWDGVNHYAVPGEKRFRSCRVAPSLLRRNEPVTLLSRRLSDGMSSIRGPRGFFAPMSYQALRTCRTGDFLGVEGQTFRVEQVHRARNGNVNKLSLRETEGQELPPEPVSVGPGSTRWTSELHARKAVSLGPDLEVDPGRTANLRWPKFLRFGREDSAESFSARCVEITERGSHRLYRARVTDLSDDAKKALGASGIEPQGDFYEIPDSVFVVRFDALESKREPAPGALSGAQLSEQWAKLKGGPVVGLRLDGLPVTLEGIRCTADRHFLQVSTPEPNPALLAVAYKASVRANCSTQYTIPAGAVTITLAPPLAAVDFDSKNASLARAQLPSAPTDTYATPAATRTSSASGKPVKPVRAKSLAERSATRMSVEQIAACRARDVLSIGEFLYDVKGVKRHRDWREAEFTLLEQGASSNHSVCLTATELVGQAKYAGPDRLLDEKSALALQTETPVRLRFIDAQTNYRFNGVCDGVRTVKGVLHYVVRYADKSDATSKALAGLGCGVSDEKILVPHGRIQARVDARGVSLPHVPAGRQPAPGTGAPPGASRFRMRGTLNFDTASEDDVRRAQAAGEYLSTKWNSLVTGSRDAKDGFKVDVLGVPLTVLKSAPDGGTLQIRMPLQGPKSKDAELLRQAWGVQMVYNERVPGFVDCIVSKPGGVGSASSRSTPSRVMPPKPVLTRTGGVSTLPTSP